MELSENTKDPGVVSNLGGLVRSSDIPAEYLRIAELSGLLQMGELCSWRIPGTSKSLAYSTHGVFRFFGKFPPPIASHLIKLHTQPGELVWDPMCGSGTSGVESLLSGRRAILTDVNPLSLMLARVKTRKIGIRQLEKVLAQILANSRHRPAQSEPFVPVGLRNYSHWFLPETITSLQNIRSAVLDVVDPDVRELFLVCFSSIIRKVSRATSQQGRLFLDVETAVSDALPVFEKKALAIIKAVSSLPECETGTIQVAEHNLVESALLSLDSSPALVILHPPYFNSYKYSGINSLELSWLGVSHSDIRKAEVREFFKVGKAENWERYVEDMVSCLKNVAASVTKGTAVCLMIGDTVLKSEYIPVTKEILFRVRNAFEVEEVALRIPQFTESSWVASQRRGGGDVGVKLCDFVVTLRKL